MLPVLALVLLAAAAQSDDAKDKKKAVLERGELKPSGPMLFEPGTDALKAETDAVLGEVKEALAAREYITLLRIEVHCDSDGDAAEGQALTEKRALAVAKRLVALGVDCKRLVPVGFGSTKPLAENNTPENKAKNRRTAFVVAALRGRLIGGTAADGGGRPAGDPCGK